MTKKLDLKDLTGQPDENVVYQQIAQGDNKPSDEISMKATEELLSNKKLKTVSRLKFDQVSVISKLYMFSEVFGEKFPRQLADLILQLQISTNGLGRRELVQLVQQRNMMAEMEEQKRPSKEIFR